MSIILLSLTAIAQKQSTVQVHLNLNFSLSVLIETFVNTVFSALNFRVFVFNQSRIIYVPRQTDY